MVIEKIEQKGHVPQSRAFFGLTALSNNKMVMYGGLAGKMFNDVRVWNSETFFWDLGLKDEKRNTLAQRFGYAIGSFANYLVIFGGYGEKLPTARTR